MVIRFITHLRKAFYGIMLLGILFSSFGSGLLPAVHAQDGLTGTPIDTPIPPGTASFPAAPAERPTAGFRRYARQ